MFFLADVFLFLQIFVCHLFELLLSSCLAFPLSILLSILFSFPLSNLASIRRRCVVPELLVKFCSIGIFCFVLLRVSLLICSDLLTSFINSLVNSCVHL